MGTTDVNKFGLVELANRTHNGVTIDLANELTEKIPVLKDAPFKEANDVFSHREGKVKVLPTVSLRGINKGIKASAAQTEPKIWEMCIVEDRSEIDELSLEGVSDAPGQRDQEDTLHLEAMRQKFGAQFLYGNHATDIKELNGITTLYADLSLDNVNGCGGTGSDLSSFWIIQWGFDGVFLFYPRGHQYAGVEQIDKGLERVADSTGSAYYYAWVTQFKFRWGLAVKRDDAIQRICNIETSGAQNTLDDDELIKAYNRLPDPSKAVAYCNGTLKSQLDIIAKDKPNVIHTEKDPFGRPVTYFWDIPIRKFDSILITEDAVT